MAQTTSNVVPAAQTALNNAQQATWAQKQTALRALGARNPIAKVPTYTPNATSFSPTLSIQGPSKIAASSSPITGGSTTATGLSSLPQTQGMVNPRTIAPAITQPLASATIQPAQTPEQFRESMGNPTTGPGSLDPTQNPQQKPTDYSGGTFDQSGNFTPAPVPPTTTTPYSATTPPTSQAGLIGSALGQAQNYYDRQAGLVQQAQDVASRIGQEQAATTGQFSGTASDEAGRIAQLENIKQATMGQIQQQQATLAGYQAPLTSTYGTAIGAAQPQLGAYGQTFYQPLQAGQGGATGGAGVNPSDPFYATLQSYAQMAAKGQLSQIPSSITGNAVLNAQMNEMAKQINPSYNPVQSQASAATQAQGQQIQTQTKTANDALNTLGTSFNALSSLQTGGIPATNSIAQWIGTELGDSALSKYKSNLADARAQLVGVLNTAGGTPTGNEATAMQYLPDNMTPAMFAQNVGTVQNPGIVRQLMQQKVTQFTGSGQQQTGTNTNQNAPSNIYSW